MTSAQANPTDPIDATDTLPVDQVLLAVEQRNADVLHDLLDPLHPADIADLLEQVGPDDRTAILDLWRGGIDGDVLSELDESLREDIIDGMEPEQLADVVRDLDSDDVVDLVEDLADAQQEAVLDALEDADRAVVEQSLSFPEESAGRLMQREVVFAPQYWNVGQTIDYLRKTDDLDLPEQFYHVILVDMRHKPVNVHYRNRRG
ncbi:MAG: magnesium transporter, partial [Pseudomonadota bacterium]